LLGIRLFDCLPYGGDVDAASALEVV